MNKQTGWKYKTNKVVEISEEWKHFASYYGKMKETHKSIIPVLKDLTIKFSRKELRIQNNWRTIWSIEWWIVWSGQHSTDVPQRTGFSGLTSSFSTKRKGMKQILPKTKRREHENKD